LDTWSFTSTYTDVKNSRTYTSISSKVIVAWCLHESGWQRWYKNATSNCLPLVASLYSVWIFPYRTQTQNKLPSSALYTLGSPHSPCTADIVGSSDLWDGLTGSWKVNMIIYASPKLEYLELCHKVILSVCSAVVAGYSSFIFTALWYILKQQVARFHVNILFRTKSHLRILQCFIL
jgi:hypothetical protein